MIAAYIPHNSDDASPLLPQCDAINSFAQQRGLKIDYMMASKDADIGTFLSNFQSGDIMIVNDLSSLGKNLKEITTTLKTILSKGIHLYTANGRYAFDNADTMEVTIKAVDMILELESRIISKRTKDGLRQKRAEGHKLGRPRGATVKVKVIEANLDYIAESQANGLSELEICNAIGVSRSTFRRYFAGKGKGI